jgi:hypothetical protein
MAFPPLDKANLVIAIHLSLTNWEIGKLTLHRDEYISRLCNKVSFSTHTQLIIRSKIMLNKASLFGVLAAVLAIAPSAAFAQDQVAGSNTQINQGSSVVGVGNVTGQNANSVTTQDQFKNQFCAAGNQVAGANTGLGQFSGTSGIGNVTGQNANSATGQFQSNTCYSPYSY